MRKIFTLLMLGATVALTSCTKEDSPVTTPDTAGKEISVRISAQQPSQALQTRTPYSNPVLQNMRVILLVMENNLVIYSETKTNVDFSQSVDFEARLISGKSYQIACWADYGDSYYTVNSTIGSTPQVSMANTTIVGSDNKRDAYFSVIPTTITSSTSISMSLKRPFGLIKINTADYSAAVLSQTDLLPKHYAIAAIKVPTTMNLCDGSVGTPQTVSIETTEVASTTGELAFDYFFASNDPLLLEDFNITLYKDDAQTTILSYPFKQIPIRRNYVTNIDGNLLTRPGRFSISIDPVMGGVATTHLVTNGEMLKQTLATAVDGDIIELQEGDYALTLNNPADGYLLVTKNNITLKGQGASTVIYGATESQNGSGPTQSIIYVTGTNFTMENITLMPKPGPADQLNKAIEIAAGGTITLRNCTFAPNTILNGPADNAGSVFLNPGNNATANILIDNCVLQNSQLLIYNCPGTVHVTVQGTLFKEQLIHPAGLYAKGSIVSNRDSSQPELSNYAEVSIQGCTFTNVSAPMVPEGNPEYDARRFDAAIRVSYGNFILGSNNTFDDPSATYWACFRSGTVNGAQQ